MSFIFHVLPTRIKAVCQNLLMRFYLLLQLADLHYIVLSLLGKRDILWVIRNWIHKFCSAFQYLFSLLLRPPILCFKRSTSTNKLRTYCYCQTVMESLISTTYISHINLLYIISGCFLHWSKPKSSGEMHGKLLQWGISSKVHFGYVSTSFVHIFPRQPIEIWHFIFFQVCTYQEWWLHRREIEVYI